MLGVVILSCIVLSVIMLSVIMLNVEAPYKQFHLIWILLKNPSNVEG
jgi:hypothetical protein